MTLESHVTKTNDTIEKLKSELRESGIDILMAYKCLKCNMVFDDPVKFWLHFEQCEGMRRCNSCGSILQDGKCMKSSCINYNKEVERNAD